MAVRIRTSYHPTSDSLISISCPSVRAPTARHPKSERDLDPERAFATETLCTCARVHVHVCVRPSQSLVLGSDREVLFIGTF